MAQVTISEPDEEFGWWPLELRDCEWRMRPFRQSYPKADRFQVRSKGAGDDAWRDVPVNPLDEPPFGEVIDG